MACAASSVIAWARAAGAWLTATPNAASATIVLKIMRLLSIGIAGIGFSLSISSDLIRAPDALGPNLESAPRSGRGLERHLRHAIGEVQACVLLRDADRLQD